MIQLLKYGNTNCYYIEGKNGSILVDTDWAGTLQAFYKKIKELAKIGKSIIVISSELEEITQLCDRVVVMCEGRITKILDISEVSQQKIMEYAVRRNK